MANYDSSTVGVPYVRAHRIVIHYPIPSTGAPPSAEIEQSEAVKLADGTSRFLSNIFTLNATFDLTDQTPIPLVDPTTGVALGPTVTVGQVMLSILAVVRKHQLLAEGS